MRERLGFLLLLPIAVAMCSCNDSEGRAVDGTSSETHTSLQAFADSVAGVTVKESAPTPAGSARAARSFEDPDAVKGIRSGIQLWYSMDMGLGYDISRTEIRLLDTGAVSAPSPLDTLVNSNPAGFRVVSWWGIVPQGEYGGVRLEDSLGGTRFERWNGVTRAGFRYAMRYLDSLDRVQLRFPQPVCPGRYCEQGVMANGRSRLIEFGGRWKVILPNPNPDTACRADSLLVYENGVQIGWMILAKEAFGMPSTDFSRYKVFDMAGRVVQPIVAGSTGPWWGDSLGLFWGDPKVDDNGRDLLVPYRWMFLPGTANLIQSSAIIDSPTVQWERYPESPDTAYAFPMSFPSDTGAGVVRFAGVVPGLMAAQDWGGFILPMIKYRSAPGTVLFTSIRCDLPPIQRQGLVRD